ncbi:MAG: hypothetical protein ISP90_11970 [Nevskia sp.]|nr:hypothetical protein [Nevskia sp.]
MTEKGYFSPDIADLLATVRDTLKQVAPQLERGPAYQLHVSGFLLELALRELESGDTAAVHSQQRLSRLLGAEGSAVELTWKLCRALRAGALDARWDEVLQVLLEDNVERVRIVRPDVLAAEHRPQTT